MSVFQKLGIEPVVNCGASRSFYGSSIMSDPVREAIDSASRDYVLMSELGDAVGRRLAELTGAEWGVVSAGSAGGLALGTAACIAANDPLRMLRLPQPFHNEERVVLTPKGQRFAYDQSVRLAGARIIEVSDVAELAEALGRRHVVMILLFGERDASSSLKFDEILPLARKAGVPILVDAASEPLACPEHWTSRGADLAVYSIGKLIRGPAAAGLLLGRKPLVQAAWFNGPPHQSFGRAMKIAKEEMVGAVAAVEQWFARDLEAERRQWRQRVQTLRDRLAAIPGLKLDISALAGGIPRLKIDWSEAQPNLTFRELRRELLERRPRILIDDYGGSEHSTMISPFALGDEQIDLVGDALQAALTAARPPAAVQPPTRVEISGQWTVTLDFAVRPAIHQLRLRREGGRLEGQHLTPFGEAAASGVMTANGFELQAFHMVEGNTVSFRFVAENCASDAMSGFVELGAAASHTKGPTTFGQFGRVAFSAVPATET